MHVQVMRASQSGLWMKGYEASDKLDGVGE
jgi:hypothetical protein